MTGKWSDRKLINLVDVVVTISRYAASFGLELTVELLLELTHFCFHCCSMLTLARTSGTKLRIRDGISIITGTVNDIPSCRKFAWVCNISSGAAPWSCRWVPLTYAFFMKEGLGSVVEIDIETPGLEYAARIHDWIRFG